MLKDAKELGFVDVRGGRIFDLSYSPIWLENRRHLRDVGCSRLCFETTSKVNQGEEWQKL